MREAQLGITPTTCDDSVEGATCGACGKGTAQGNYVKGAIQGACLESAAHGDYIEGDTQGACIDCTSCGNGIKGTTSDGHQKHYLWLWQVSPWQLYQGCYQ